MPATASIAAARRSDAASATVWSSRSAPAGAGAAPPGAQARPPATDGQFGSQGTASASTSSRTPERSCPRAPPQPAYRAAATGSARAELDRTSSPAPGGSWRCRASPGHHRAPPPGQATQVLPGKQFQKGTSRPRRQEAHLWTSPTRRRPPLRAGGRGRRARWSTSRPASIRTTPQPSTPCCTSCTASGGASTRGWATRISQPRCSRSPTRVSE